MKKILLIAILLVVCIGCGFAISRSIHGESAQMSPPAPPQVPLPSGYSRIRIGMTEDQVTALLGKPMLTSVNPRFEVKTEQQWSAIAARAQAAPTGDGVSAGAPSLQAIKLGAELNHRVKETLRYQPNSTAYVSLEFDGRGKLIKFWMLPITHPSH
jgi:hypothetical protein